MITVSQKIKFFKNKISSLLQEHNIEPEILLVNSGQMLLKNTAENKNEILINSGKMLDWIEKNPTQSYFNHLKIYKEILQSTPDTALDVIEFLSSDDGYAIFDITYVYYESVHDEHAEDIEISKFDYHLAMTEINYIPTSTETGLAIKDYNKKLMGYYAYLYS